MISVRSAFLALALTAHALAQSPEIASHLDDLIGREVAAHGLKAISVAVVDGGRVVYSHDAGAPAGAVYRVGSVSKLFTDIAVMQLVGRGELDLDAPVSRYLPDFHPKNPYPHPITLRHLMSHRSGVVREPPVGHYFDDTHPTLRDTVASLNDTELVYAPGEKTKYSNAGIAVVGYVLEVTQHTLFAEYMRHAVLEPLQMSESAFAPEPAVLAKTAPAWMWTFDGREFPAPVFPLGMAPAGSMYSTTADLAKFVDALFHKGAPMLKQETMEQMWAPQFAAPSDKTGFGLGFRLANLEGHRLVGHGGAIYGFATELEALPEDGLGAIAITNKDGANASVNLIAGQALRWMLDSRAGRALRPMPETSRLPEAPTDPVTPEAPPSIPKAWEALIGEYGWDYDTLFIHERGGKLSSLIEWFFLDALTERGPDVFQFPDTGLYAGERAQFLRGANGGVTGVRIGGVTFPRRPDPAAPGATFRIQPVRPVAELRRIALEAKPPAESGDFLEPDLVELVKLDSSIHLDIRYASTNNFLGTPLYTQARAFLVRPATEALVRAHRKLRARGYGLLIHDGYRPWSVTKMFWDGTPPDKHNFVADPAQGSRHNRGCAVDLTLYDLATNRPVQMTGGYDEMSPRSYPNYPGGTSAERWRRDLLRRTMEAEGFQVYEFEWWHFDFGGWKRYPILNKPFESL